MKEGTSVPVKGMEEIIHLYEELDRIIGRLKECGNMECPELCGRCCKTPAMNVESSVIEALPLVINLLETGQVDFFYEMLDKFKDCDPCIFYTDEIREGNRGRCSVYRYRPLVCRLFGYSAVINKHGKIAPALCSTIKEAMPGCAARITSLIERGLPVPVFSEYTMRSSMLNPAIGFERYPVNMAVKKAIEFVGLQMSYSSSRDTGSDDESPDNIPPVTSRGRKCA